jgi:hypothetical protein
MHDEIPVHIWTKEHVLVLVRKSMGVKQNKNHSVLLYPFVKSTIYVSLHPKYPATSSVLVNADWGQNTMPPVT